MKGGRGAPGRWHKMGRLVTVDWTKSHGFVVREYTPEEGKLPYGLEVLEHCAELALDCPRCHYHLGAFQQGLGAAWFLTDLVTLTPRGREALEETDE